MFQLTRRERRIVCLLLLALVVGLGVRQWRRIRAMETMEQTSVKK